MNSNMPRCRTCRHWQLLKGNYGVCALIGDDLHVPSKPMHSEAYVTAHSSGGFEANSVLLETKHSFGCILHEERGGGGSDYECLLTRPTFGCTLWEDRDAK